ncbi:MAG: hypothetical protein QOF58_6649 [Pseudonocardiales bacterium]|jgi:hypothetical protein|nr:hypothetical protein [Actinomycetota bacterium]MDT7788230.1 hypothetical protein [Pseudonocardiales bacterium]
MSRRRSPAWVGQPVVVCVGGPLDGRWYLLADLDAMRTAAQLTGYTADHPSGAALGYDATAGTRVHPYEDVLGQVYRHADSAAGRARHHIPAVA